MQDDEDEEDDDHDAHEDDDHGEGQSTHQPERAPAVAGGEPQPLPQPGSLGGPWWWVWYGSERRAMLCDAFEESELCCFQLSTKLLFSVELTTECLVGERCSVFKTIERRPDVWLACTRPSKELLF